MKVEKNKRFRFSTHLSPSWATWASTRPSGTISRSLRSWSSRQRVWSQVKSSEAHVNISPRSRPCSLEEQYFKCGIFWGYDTAQRHASNSEAPVLAGRVSVFLRGSQFSGASELKEGLVFKCKFIWSHWKAPIVSFLQLYNWPRY